MDISNFLANGLVLKIIGGILGALGLLKWMKNKSIQRWAQVAFDVVEEADRINQQEGDKAKTLDKIAMFNQKFIELMKRAGWWVVSEQDSQQAAEIAKAINVIYENSKNLVNQTKQDIKNLN